MKLAAKTGLFFSGLTNKYPGFDLQIHDNWQLEFTLPQKPNRYFAIPLLGGLSRIILLLPYAVYSQVIARGSGVGMVISSVPVLFSGKYPESTYEMGRDAIRLSLRQGVYFAGISDTYPSWYISMNHKAIKIILIIVGALMILGQSSARHERFNHQNYNNNGDYGRNYMPSRHLQPPNNTTPQTNGVF